MQDQGGKKPKEKKKKRGFVKKCFGGFACFAPTTSDSSGEIVHKRLDIK